MRAIVFAAVVALVGGVACDKKAEDKAGADKGTATAATGGDKAPAGAAEGGDKAPAAPAGNGIADVKGLATAAAKAISAGDSAAYGKLVMPAGFTKTLCSDLAVDDNKEKARYAAEVGKSKAAIEGKACKAYDWSKAKLVSVSGGNKPVADKICPNVNNLGELGVHYKIDGKHVVVQLPGAVASKDGKSFYVTGAPTCRDGVSGATAAAGKGGWEATKAELLKKAKGFTAAVCACKDEACTNPIMSKFMADTGKLVGPHNVSKADQDLISAAMKPGMDCIQKLGK